VIGVTTNPGTLSIDPGYQEAPLGDSPPLNLDSQGSILGLPYKATVVEGPNAGRTFTFECTHCASLQGEPFTYEYTPAPGGQLGDDKLEIWLDTNDNNVIDAGEDYGFTWVHWSKAVHAVGFGDSYSSGEGVDPYDPGTDDDWGADRNQCHRSLYAYARESQPLGYRAVLPSYVGGPTDTKVDFVACSGATSENVRVGGTPQYDEPGTQLDQGQLDANTDLVTLTLGGNDMGFTPVITKCVKQDCLSTSARINGIWVQDWFRPCGLASDTFERTVSNGWGSADIGGAWTPVGGTSNFSVGGHVGSITLPNVAASPVAKLAVPSTNNDQTVRISLSKLANGGGTTIDVGSRSVDQNAYRLRIAVASNGRVTLKLIRTLGGADTQLSSVLLPSGTTLTTTNQLQVRFQTQGTGPTTLRARAWLVGAYEPTGWQTSATDATWELQGYGTFFLAPKLSASTSNYPVIARFDDYTVEALP